jgi:glycine cleavage system H lipoate-binding protein
MAKKAHKQQASALDEVRRHVRIFIDLGRVASESADEDGFLDQVVVQVARAVEIDHVKVLRYSDFGQCSLGDILSLELPAPGAKVKRGAAAGWVDSYRRAADIPSPVSGEVIWVDESTRRDPRRINAYPYARGGIFKLRLSSPKEYEELMPFENYAEQLRKLRRYDEWTNELRVT